MIESNTTIGFWNISYFPTPCMDTLNHELPYSTKYLLFFLTFLSISHGLYKYISIS